MFLLPRVEFQQVELGLDRFVGGDLAGMKIVNQGKRE